MLPRQDLGWHHEGALRPAFNRGCERKQRNNGFARSHIALQQAQHARWRRHVGLYFRIGKTLSVCKPIGQGADDLGLSRTVAHKTSPRRPFHVATHQTERQLVGQKFVIGQP